MASNIYIKNMVCPRCVAAVDTIFKEIGHTALQVKLGEVVIEKDLNDADQELLKLKLNAQGFELLDDNKKQQIEKIKSIVIEHIHHLDDAKFHFSEIISHQLNKEYSQLSKLFSTTEGITIEQFIILQKVEKVKELLVYDQLNLSEIAFKMGYSSVAHLSSQFKKTIGLTPTQFKAQGIQLRKGIDSI